MVGNVSRQIQQSRGKYIVLINTIHIIHDQLISKTCERVCTDLERLVNREKGIVNKLDRCGLSKIIIYTTLLRSFHHSMDYIPTLKGRQQVNSYII